MRRLAICATLLAASCGPTMPPAPAGNLAPAAPPPAPDETAAQDAAPIAAPPRRSSPYPHRVWWRGGEKEIVAASPGGEALPGRWESWRFCAADGALVGRWRQSRGVGGFGVALTADRKGRDHFGREWTWIADEGRLELVEAGSVVTDCFLSSDLRTWRGLHDESFVGTKIDEDGK